MATDSGKIPSLSGGIPSLLIIQSAREVKAKGLKPKQHKTIPVINPFFSGKYFQQVLRIG